MIIKIYTHNKQDEIIMDYNTYRLKDKKCKVKF